MDDQIFPEPFNKGMLKVTGTHKISFTESGNPKGIPVVNIHGGPGSQSKPKHLKMFDLDVFRVIQLDQRGCGESFPRGELEENTTTDLINDTEKLREYLRIDKWIVSGGSWGATLALLYSQKYPTSASGLFIRSVFLARKVDQEWLFNPGGASRFFPEVWGYRSNFLKDRKVKESESHSYMLERLINGSESEKREVAATIGAWEGNIMTLENKLEIPDPDEVTEEDILDARLFLHYDTNSYFLKSNQILKDIGKIKKIPTMILQGRYDVVTPPAQAYAVHQSLQNSTIEITNFDGHKLSKDSEKVGYYMLKSFADSLE